jgi:hypothetical protein
MTGFVNSTAGTVIRFISAVVLLFLVYLNATTLNPLTIQSSALALCGVYVFVIAFQVALIAGAPLGHFTQGGASDGALDSKGKRAATVSVVLLVLFAWHVLTYSEVVPMEVPTLFSSILQWTLIAYTIIGTILNAISRSMKESVLWTPVMFLSFGLLVSIYGL